MLQIVDINGDLERETKKLEQNFCINDHVDLLIEVLQRLDGRSLAAAACVCRQWCSIVRNDSLWEHLCFGNVSPPPSIGIRSVVLALGGYRRLYMVCVRPVASQLKRRRIDGGESEVVRRVWNRHEVELSLSLFCVEYYERLLGGGGVVGGESRATSLKFLCKAVNVSI
ncbi:F-box protein SNE-like [Cynara cardunculus var. scolymus]|uniref:F-box domain, cyclin-like protein n=1 Tax=Cynara cardunculus var. scolymus TaxID=59895 RepID=A0A103Y3V1_CYNCS|nr:F-box protein SNE-like [Cynara cardunculus var. scolymus]KVI02063.1 F-box domain, cyclin-like protein [Cynara cardunculus var. scolymus]